MYSVEDLLISHGYKLPKHAASSSTPTPTAVSSTYPAPSSSPPSYSKRHEFLEGVPGHSRTVNGYERGPYGNSDGAGHSQVHIGSCSNNNESRDRGQPRRVGLSRSQIDIHSLGDSLISDSFVMAPKVLNSSPRMCPTGEEEGRTLASYWTMLTSETLVVEDRGDMVDQRDLNKPQSKSYTWSKVRG